MTRRAWGWTALGLFAAAGCGLFAALAFLQLAAMHGWVIRP